MDFFWHWLAEQVALSNGSVLTAFGAFGAGLMALIGVVVSVWSSAKRSRQALGSAAEDRRQNALHHKDLLERGRREQEALELREKESARNSRFSVVVGQLASEKSTERMGGLYSLSALADEWDQEARRLLGNNLPAPHSDPVIPPEMKRSVDPLNRKYAPAIVQNALGQRDACIGLVCAYLRATPVGQMSEEPWPTPNEPAPKPTFEQPSVPLGATDWDARAEAVSIIREHLGAKAVNPWPGDRINLDGADLRYHNFFRCHFEFASLNRVRLDHAHLSYSQMHGAQLMEAELHHARAVMVQLVNAHLENAQLQYADMSGANFRHSWMTGVDLRDADLTGAQLEGTWLHSSHLEGTMLGGVHFGEAWEGHLVPFPDSPGKLPSWDTRTQWPADVGPKQILALAAKRGLITAERERLLRTQQLGEFLQQHVELPRRPPSNGKA